MPVIFRQSGYRFHFFSFEGSPREPVHIHVSRPGGTAKLWLYPVLRMAYNRRLDPRELRLIEQIVVERREEIEREWNAFFARADNGQI
ncbi:DUF4160 domain-containing protein [uncultured Sphingomonas sp.]|uniref:DUF4160 domain-containing protein n=1 Tax=uncultured Sphingomonas sp. TaxID=158754 RepID=UPI0035CB6FFA